MENGEPTGPEDEGSLLSQLARAGLSSVATNLAINVVADGLVAAQMPDGAAAHQGPLDLEGEIISGPAEGGGFVERPLAAPLAEHSLGQSLDVTYGDGGSIAAAEGQGAMSVNGREIDLTNYVPGSEYYYATEGGLNEVDGLAMMGQASLTYGKTAAIRNAAQQTIAEAERSDGLAPSSFDSGLMDESGLAYGSEASGDHSGNGIAAVFGRARGQGTDGGAEDDHPDAPHRKQLEREHRLDVAEALRTTDVAQVTTEVSNGDGSVSITTAFEAFDPDEDKEKKVGDEHVREALHSPHNEMNLHLQHIHMQTQIEENERGLSRSR